MPNSFYISTDLNVSGNSYFASGVTALNYYGNASNLSGIAKGGGTGGQVYYFNLSNTQYPYYEFSNSATTAPQSSLSVTTGASQTAYVGGFMTPTKVPGVTTLPLGIISFYLHCQNDTNSYNYDVYCELYKINQSNVETLLFTSDPTPVLTDTIEMIVTDGYFSGATLNTSDRLIVKIYATNVTSSSHTFYFYSEGSEHYSFSLTTIPSGILSINAGSGISASTLNGVSTIVNTDLGSSQNIFKNIQAGGVTQFSAGSNSANLNFSGINVSITSAATNTLVFSASTNYVTGSGTTRYIPAWNGTSTLNDTIIYNATDKIGINTTIPNAILHVQTITTSDEGLIVSGNTNLGRNMVRITQTGGGNALLVEDSSNPDSTPFVINASGNVGIGTDSPTTLLHVSGDSIISGTLTSTTISATTYQNLPVSGLTSSSGIGLVNNNGNYTISNTGVTSVTATSGLSGNSTTGAITLINTDLGSSQNIFKNIQAGGVTQFSAGSNSANLNFSGINITITSDANNTLVFSAGTGGGVTGSGTSNYLPRWIGTTSLGNSIIRDDGTNVGIDTPSNALYKTSIYSITNIPLFVQNQTTNGTGIFVFANGSGSQTAISANANGLSSSDNIGVYSVATDGLIAIGVKGTVDVSEFGTVVTGIGGYFDGRGPGSYTFPTNSYSVQLIDGTEGTNKVLISTTSDGKANWSNTLTGLTNVRSTTISATTYQNLPVSAVTNGTGISTSTNNNGVATITNTDLGSSQNIFKNIQVGGVTQFSAGSNSANLNFSGINITITSAANNTLVFSAGTGGAGSVTSVTAGTGLSGNSTTGAITLINTGVTSFQQAQMIAFLTS